MSESIIMVRVTCGVCAANTDLPVNGTTDTLDVSGLTGWSFTSDAGWQCDACGTASRTAIPSAGEPAPGVEPVAWRLMVDGEGPEYATLHKTREEAEKIAKRDEALVAVIEPLGVIPDPAPRPAQEEDDER